MLLTKERYEKTSSMTGRAAKLGLLVFNGKTEAVGFVLLIIVSFIVGACFSTLITQKIGLTGGLFFTSLMLIITTFTSLKSRMHLSFITIPIAMGALNAATSLSKALGGAKSPTEQSLTTIGW